MKKILVSYFSASGVTARVAQKLSQAIDGDLHEIIPAQPYSQADLNWTNPQSRSSQEMKNKAYRPAIQNEVKNIDDYDVIFIGFPIWWYVAPTIINTFLEQYDLSGKTIIPFSSHGGSGWSGTVDDIAGMEPNATMVNGYSISRSSVAGSEEGILQWLERIGMLEQQN